MCFLDGNKHVIFVIICTVKAALFYSNARSGLQIFCETKFKTGGEKKKGKKRSKLVFSCKNGLKQW